jgi:tetratricopeptide (TPR) repeat protein
MELDENKFPFAKYATSYWCHHLTYSKLDAQLVNQAKQFLGSKNKRRLWLMRWLLADREASQLQYILRMEDKVRNCIVGSSDDAEHTLDFIQLEDVFEVLIKCDELWLQRQEKFPDNVQSTNCRAEAWTPSPIINNFQRNVFIRELAREYTRSGRVADGITQLEKAHPRLKKLCTDGLENMAWIHNSLGIMYDQQGQTEFAVQSQLQALALQQAAREPNQLDISLTTNELGRLYRHQGEYGQAEEMHLQSLQTLRSILPDTDMHVIWTLNHLGRCYRLHGRLEEALALLREASSARTLVLGASHPHTLWTLSDLAKCYRDLGRLDEACQLQEDCHRARNNTLGPRHHDTLWGINDLGIMYERDGRIMAAVGLHKEAWEGQVKTLGAHHQATVWSFAEIQRLESSLAGRQSGMLGVQSLFSK